MKTTIPEIVAYWEKVENESDLSVDWAEASTTCWRCGYKSALQRCHIIPDALNGLDTPSNLVLLCGRCHREAPNVSDSKFMWRWLRAHATPYYRTYWTERGLREFEFMYGRKPFTAIDDGAVTKEQIVIAMEKHMRATCIHFGEGRLNPSTIAWVIAQVEEEFLSNPSNLRS